MRNEYFSFQKGDLFIMQENYKVYVITNKSNGKQYVGQTKHTLKRRMQWHIKDAKKGVKKFLSDAIREYGVENFDIQIIEENISPSYIDECERFWIKKLNTLEPFGYNTNTGGRKGYAILCNSYKKSWYGNVIMYDKNTMEHLLVFSNTMEAERYLKAHGKIKANHWAITKCCFGRNKTAYGYKWIFENYQGEQVKYNYKNEV